MQRGPAQWTVGMLNSGDDVGVVDRSLVLPWKHLVGSIHVQRLETGAFPFLFVSPIWLDMTILSPQLCLASVHRSS
jgi:hypothetical protein